MLSLHPRIIFAKIYPFARTSITHSNVFSSGSTRSATRLPDAVTWGLRSANIIKHIFALVVESVGR